MSARTAALNGALIERGREMARTMVENAREMADRLRTNAEEIARSVEALTDQIDERLAGRATQFNETLSDRARDMTGLLAEGHDRQIRDLLAALNLPTWHEALERVNAAGERAILHGLDEFREHLGGELTVTLLHDIGSGTEVHAMDERLVVQAIDWLRAAAGA